METSCVNNLQGPRTRLYGWHTRGWCITDRIWHLFYGSDYNADGIKSTVAFSRGCHLWFSAKGYIRTPMIKCCRLRFIVQWTAKFSANKSFQMKIVQLWVHNWIVHSAHVGYFWSLTWQYPHSSISLCIWYVFHKCPAQQPCWWSRSSPLVSGLPAYLHSVQMVGWNSLPKAHHKICIALKSPPKPDIWACRGFKKRVHCAVACGVPVNRVTYTRKSFHVF